MALSATVHAYLSRCCKKKKGKKGKKNVAGSLNLFSPAALHNDAARSHADDGEGSLFIIQRNNEAQGLRRCHRITNWGGESWICICLWRLTALYIVQVPPSVLVIGCMMDGRAGGAPLSVGQCIYLSVYLFIPSFSETLKNSGFVLRRRRRKSVWQPRKMLPVLQCLPAGWVFTDVGQGFALPALFLPSCCTSV